MNRLIQLTALLAIMGLTQALGAADLKGEETPSGTMCTGPADMDLDTDYVYGECSRVCRGRTVVVVDGIYDCTGSFNTISLEIQLSSEDADAEDANLVIPANGLAELVRNRTDRRFRLDVLNPQITILPPRNEAQSAVAYCKRDGRDLSVEFQNVGTMSTGGSTIVFVSFMTSGGIEIQQDTRGPLEIEETTTLRYEIPRGCFNPDCDFTIQWTNQPPVVGRCIG